MSDATIGPGSAVVKIDSGPAAPIGTVAFVLDILHDDGVCDECGYLEHRLLLSLPHMPHHIGWCPNHWRPYSGIEEPTRTSTTIPLKEPEPA